MKPIKILFILFSLFTIHHSLFARDALPILVEGGEPFENREDFYMPQQSEINAVAISVNGKIIISGSDDRTIKIWNRATGTLEQTLEGHEGLVNSVAISNDGKTIISGSDDRTIKIWNRSTGTLEQTLEGHEGLVNSVAISNDGKTIISGSDDTTIKIWNRVTGALIHTLEGHEGPVNSIAISKDAKTIISASSDRTIKIWNRATGTLEQTLEGHKSFVNSVVISQDGRIIISGSGDTTKIWNRATGVLEQTLEHKSFASSVAISQDGRTIISGLGSYNSSNNTIKIWNRSTGVLEQILEGHKGNVNSVTISKDGKTIISGSDDKTIKIWNISTGTLEQTLEGHKSPVNSVAISQNGNIIILGSDDSTIKIWNRVTESLMQILEGHKSSVNSIVLSKDEKTIISGSGDNTIKIWDMIIGKELQSLPTNVESLAMSSDNKTIITGLFSVTGRDGKNKIIELRKIFTGKLIKTFYEYHNPSLAMAYFTRIDTIAISQDNKIILANSFDNTIKIWNRTTGALIDTLEGHKGNVNSVAISKDGKIIISGSDDNTIKVWNRATGTLIHTLEGHKGNVNSVAISKDAKIIISGSDDNTIKIWNRATGALMQTLEVYKGSVYSIIINQDGKIIISGSNEGTVCLWDIKTGKKLKEYISGQNGTWVVFDYEKKKLFRGDNGTLLYNKNGENLSLLNPKWLSKEDKIILKSNEVSIVNDKHNTLKISVKNISDNRLYWIKNNYYADKYCHLLEHRASIINPNEDKNLSIDIDVTLPRLNPKPINNHEINLTLETATGSEFNITVPISIRYANIKVTKAEVSDDGKNLNIKIKNIGNEPLIKADVNLSKPFQADIQTLTNLEPNATKVLAFSLGDNQISDDDNLTLVISIPNEESKNAMPLYKWRSEGVKILTSSMWRIYVLLVWIVLVGAVVLWYYKRYKNPLVKKLENPKKLLTLNIDQLKEAKTRLTKIDRFENILSENHITQERYENAIKFEHLTHEEKANYLAKRVFANATELTPQSQMLTLSDDFPLNVKQFILFMSNKESIADMMSEIKQIPQYSKNILFILSDNSELQAKIATEKGYEKFVRVQLQTMTKLLLAEDGAKVLADSFAEQLVLTQISPYNLGGGESNSSMFFGRREIISHVVGRGNNNYIVIGSRQIGKSSLMKAMKREYVNNKEKVYYISIGQSPFLRAMTNKKALNIKVKNLEDLVEYISSQDEKIVFLLDEVDPFIKDERKNGYKVLDSFRKLSEEGSCNFILAGYWELYFYTMFDNQSPLKNFGEAIELGALEADACREMITEPMQQLGLCFESDEAINEIVERTGQRPNLIAIICNNIIKSLGKEKRVVSMADVQEAIKGKKVYELFESWKKLDEDEEASKLDKIIVYSMVEQGSFRLAELVERLKTLGLKVEMSRLETSLARLKVSYTIERNEEGVYGFMLPLFREYVLRDDYEVKLAGEVEGF